MDETERHDNPWGTEPGEHPLESEETDVSGAQETVEPTAPASEREPTGQTGSATEQYAGAGSTPDSEPALEADGG